MWESPIRIIEEDLQMQIKDEVFSAIRRAGFDIDKDELIKALNYDRGQYEKGFHDGYAKAKSEIIRCKDCRFAHLTYDGDCKYCNKWTDEFGIPMELFLDDDFYCGFAKRREDE